MELLHFLFFAIFLPTIFGQVPIQGHAPPQLSILNSQTIQLSNFYRPNGKVQFALQGVNITKVSEKNKNLWFIELNNGQNIEYYMANGSASYGYNASRYFFKWNNTGGHGFAHEVCFDFSFNNATWYQTYLEPNQKFPIGS